MHGALLEWLENTGVAKTPLLFVKEAYDNICSKTAKTIGFCFFIPSILFNFGGRVDSEPWIID